LLGERPQAALQNQEVPGLLTLLLVPLISVLIGVLAAKLGIGGGSLMVPILNLGVGLPLHIAVATSKFIIVFTALFGAATHLRLGHVIPEYLALLGVGTVVGAQIGARIARRLKPSWLRKIFSIVLTLMGLRMVLRAL